MKKAVADDEYDPEMEKIKKRKTYTARRSRSSIKSNNLKRKRSKAERKADNLKQNPKRSKAYIKDGNSRRKLKSDISGMEYDISSPFPPTAEQVTFTGKILGNSIAALFAQQSPSPEISYAVVVAEQL